MNAMGVILMGRKVPRLQIPEKRISIENSSDILRYLFGARSNLIASKHFQIGGDVQKLEEKVKNFLEPNIEDQQDHIGSLSKLETMLDTLGKEHL